MSDKTKRAAGGPALTIEALDDDALDRTCGGGLLDTEAGTFGAKSRYIGETEKGVWKAPAGLRVTYGAESKS
ncbi:MAG: hypothetical protein AAFN27_01265 [Pseudomonadota bacterium]